MVLVWREYQVEDGYVLAPAALVCAAALASGRCDEALFFGMVCAVCAVWAAANAPALGLPAAAAALAAETTPRLSAQASVGLAVAIAALARKSVHRYLPAASVALYCGAVGLALRATAWDESGTALSGAVGCMVALSAVSGHILRLHVAAAVFCGALLLFGRWGEKSCAEGDECGVTDWEWDRESLLGPVGMSLCLSMGFVACAVHDVVVFFALVPSIDLFLLSYVLLGTFFLGDAGLELVDELKKTDEMEFSLELVRRTSHGKLTWEDGLETLSHVTLDLGWSESLQFRTLLAFAPPFCVAFSTTMAIRRLISPSARWRKERLLLGLSTTIFFLLSLGALILATDKAVRWSFWTSPLTFTAVTYVFYLQVSCVTDSTKFRVIKHGRWYTMLHFTDAFPEDFRETRRRFYGGSNLGLEPPPFYIPGAEDMRVVKTAEALSKQLRLHRSLTARIAQREQDDEAGQEIHSLREETELQIATALAACKAAVYAEKVALQLRELASDAEIERNVLVSIKKRAMQDPSSHEHPMVIRRQAHNASATFSLLREEMSAAETRAERLMEVSRQEIRVAMEKYALCRRTTTEKNSRHELDEIMASMTSQIDAQIMVPVQWGYHVKRAKQLAKNHGNLTRQGSDESGVSMDARATPYDRAMQQKGIVSPPASASELDEGKNSSADKKVANNILQTSQIPFTSSRSAGAVTTSLSDSQRTRKRKWWPFSKRARAHSALVKSTSASSGSELGTADK